jgi:WD40 repeat protein
MEYRGHNGVVSCLLVKDDILISGSFDRTIRVWKMTK